MEIFDEVDLLLAREREQQIERTLEALDVDDQRRLVGGELRRQSVVEMTVPSRHACIVRASLRRHALPSARRTRARAAATSKSAGVRRAASAASARRAASPASGGHCAATCAHLVELAVAVEHDIAAGRERRAAALGERSRQGPHRHVVTHQQRRRNRSCRRITSRTIVPEVVAGATGSMRAEHNMCGHPQGKFRERPERREIACLQGGAIGRRPPAGDDGCRRSRGHGPGMCLSTGSTPPSIRPSATAAPIAATLVGRRAVGAVADHRIGLAHRHVGERQAVDVDAERDEIARDQPRAEPRGREPLARGRGRRSRRRRRRADSSASAAARAAAPARPPGRSAPARCARPLSRSAATRRAHLRRACRRCA